MFDFDQPNPGIFKKIQKLFWLTPSHLENFQTEKWLELLKNTQIKHIVQLSSIHPEIFNLDHFERLVEKSKIPYTILRANTFMQNFNKYEKKSIERDHAFYFPAHSGKTSFIDIRDIAKAAANILLIDNDQSKIYTLTGPEALDYYQVAQILSNALQKPIKYIDTWAYPEYESEDKKK